MFLFKRYYGHLLASLWFLSFKLAAEWAEDLKTWLETDRINTIMMFRIKLGDRATESCELSFKGGGGKKSVTQSVS